MAPLSRWRSSNEINKVSIAISHHDIDAPETAGAGPAEADLSGDSTFCHCGVGTA